MSGEDCLGLRKAVLQLSMYTYTPVSYYRSMTIRDFMQTVRDYIEITQEISRVRKEAWRRRR